MRIRYVFALALAVVLLGAVGVAPVLAASNDEERPAIQWQRLLGGSGIDYGYSVQQTTDGGYVLVGPSTSSASGNVTGSNHGDRDIWVVKTDHVGTIQWERLLGGSENEYGHSVQQTTDGGFVLAGSSFSSESGDVVGKNHGTVDEFGGYEGDCWVVKLNAAGATQWQRLLGGNSSEESRSIQQTSDGGYILLGFSWSSASGDVTGTNRGGWDFWVVKLNGEGTILWQNLLGGSAFDNGYSVRETDEGGYVLLGLSASSASGDVTDTNHGSDDFWVVKLNGTGAVQWQRLLGGSEGDFGHSVQQTADGGYILLGSSWSGASGDVTGTNHGNGDFWVVKVDGAGTVQWEKLLGGSGSDLPGSVRQTGDGGYVLFGSSASSLSGNVTGINHGKQDCWVVKLDGAGAGQWQSLLGGNEDDWGHSVEQTADGGYVLLGHSWSSVSGNVTGTNHGSADIWMVRLGAPMKVLPGGTAVPTDTNGDDLFEDVNGNGRADFADVVLYFNQMTWIAANEPVASFDYNGNGRIDFADVVWLFNNL